MYLFNYRGFTLIELMIIVAIIAIILAIGIPSFFRISALSKRTACIENLRKITVAVDQWAIDSNINTGDKLTQDQENYVYSNYLRSKPACPSGGEYVINPVGSNPQVQCTLENEGHKL